MMQDKINLIKELNSHDDLSQEVGLGINVSNRLVSLLGPKDQNKITIKSSFGKGSTFKFCLKDQDYVIN